MLFEVPAVADRFTRLFVLVPVVAVPVADIFTPFVVTDPELASFVNAKEVRLAFVVLSEVSVKAYEFPDVAVEVKLAVPEVLVKFKAPVVRVKPFDAVRSPAEVVVPDPVVDIFPEVVTASPVLEGDREVPVLVQNPCVPEPLDEIQLNTPVPSFDKDEVPEACVVGKV